MIKTAIIMAGGFGERFWPLSRISKPKQLLSLGKSNKSMLEEAIDRIINLIPKENIFIITSEILTPIIRQQLNDFPVENVIPEPAKKNTAPALALATAFILARFNEAPENITIAVLTADQIMEPQENFENDISKILEFVGSNNLLNTIGIKPSRPETGYGYIEVGDIINSEFNEVKKFKEKPNLETANHYLESGNYLWNSGMFFWRADVFISEMIDNLPEVGNKILPISEKLNEKTNLINTRLTEITEIFNGFPDISIDYGLMEKSEKVSVFKASFTWDDIGDLCSLDRTKAKDNFGNTIIGESINIESKNNIIYNQNENQIITTLGLEDLVIINTKDSILITRKDRVQDVRKIVGELKNSYNDEFINLLN